MNKTEIHNKAQLFIETAPLFEELISLFISDVSKVIAETAKNPQKILDNQQVIMAIKPSAINTPTGHKISDSILNGTFLLKTQTAVLTELNYFSLNRDDTTYLTHFYDQLNNPSTVTRALAHVFVVMREQAREWDAGKSTLYKKINKISEGVSQDKFGFDVSMQSIVYETIDTFIMIMQEYTEIILNPKIRRRVLKRMVTENLLPAPYDKFDSYLSALSYTGNGFWGTIGQRFSPMCTGFLAENYSQEKVPLIHPDFLESLTTFRKMNPAKFHGGCPVSGAFTGNIHTKQNRANISPSGITKLGKFIVDQTLRVETQLQKHCK